MAKVLASSSYVLDLSVDPRWESSNGELKLPFIFIMESIVVSEMFDSDTLKLSSEIVSRDDSAAKKVATEAGSKAISLT